VARITVARTLRSMPEDLSAASLLLFEALDGASHEDRNAWRRLWKRITKFEAGECIQIDVVQPRNSKFHRKFFALLDVGFESWDPERKHKSYRGMPVAKNKEQFREDVTIMAGYYEQTFDLRGNLKLKAKSISFAKMEQEEFEELYSAVATVLLEQVLSNYKDRAELDSVVEQIIGFV
jgi:hypothetical protein